VEVLNLQLLDAARKGLYAADDVADEALLRIGRHEAEEIAGLGVVVGVAAMIVASDGSAHESGTLEVAVVLLRAAEAVGLVVDGGAPVAVEAHGAVFVIGVEGALR